MLAVLYDIGNFLAHRPFQIDSPWSRYYKAVLAKTSKATQIINAII
jgi:conjugal transfer/entry exclusion protein